MSIQGQWTKVALIAAFVAGVHLRWHGIGSLSLWFDEGYTAWIINHPIGEILRLVRADTAPPLYYLALHIWCAVFGKSEAALRGFSAMLGVATIPLVAAIARHVLAKPAAVVAATWLFVLSYSQTWYSQEARGYEMAAFLMAVMLYALVRHIESGNWRWLVLLILAAGAALYANNFMPLYVGAAGAVGLILPGKLSMRRRLRDGAIVAVSLGVIYLPWFAALRSQMNRVNNDFWIPRPNLDSICANLSQICGVSHFWSWDQYVHWIYADVTSGVPRLVTTALVIGIIAAVVFLREDNRRAAIALVVAALGAPIFMAIYSLFEQPVFFFAALVPATVVMPILIAAPLAWVTKPVVKRLTYIYIAFAIGLTAVNLWAFDREQTKEPWRDAAAAVARISPVPRRLIVFVANEAQLPFDYYHALRPGETETGAPAGFFDIDPPRTQRRVLGETDLDRLKAIVASGDFDDLLLVDSHAGWIDEDGDAHEGYSDPGALTAKWILATMRPVDRLDFPDDPARHAITIWECVKR